MADALDRSVKITQHQIVQMVSELSGLTQKQCKTVIDDYLTVVRDCCLNGLTVVIPLIGTLSPIYKCKMDERVFYNVFYKKEMTYPPREEHNVPFLKVSRYFIEEMREKTWGKPVYKPYTWQAKENECEEVGDEDGEETDRE